MNIYDIAKIAGVSIATVSRVINNRPGVSIEARNSVMDAVEKNNFIPNQLAKSLANKKTYAVGLVMPGINHYFSHRVDAINRVLKEEGYSLIITANYKDYNSIDDDIGNFNLLIEKRVDGIIYFPTHVSEKHIELLSRLEQKIPIVITDSEIEVLNVTSVVQDSFTPTQEILTYLINNGHTHIAYINGLSYDGVNQGRFSAYKSGLEKTGIPFRESYIESGNYSLESGYNAMKRLIENNMVESVLEITAVFAANDTMALGAIKAISDFGLNVPKDISVVGYDGIEFGQFYSPSLTTVRVNQYKMGQLAAEKLIRQIKEHRLIKEVVVMDYDIVMGESTGKCKGKII